MLVLSKGAVKHAFRGVLAEQVARRPPDTTVHDTSVDSHVSKHRQVTQADWHRNTGMAPQQAR